MLTLDLGNSRTKVRLWRLGPSSAPECLASTDFTGDSAEQELAAWLEHQHPAVAALCSVASAERTRRMLELLSSRVPELHASPPAGLSNRCRPPEGVGRDRLYAARGALARLGCSCLVVDAGTALTVDAVRAVPAPAPEAGLFLGGAITPGPELLARALAQGTANLPHVEPRPGAAALGQDTEAALRGGIAVGFRGAAERLVEEVARAAELDAAPVVLTGGARAFLLEPGPFTGRALHVEPELVHRGLIEAVLGVGRGRREERRP